MELGPGAEFNYNVIKRMSGQGVAYVKIKEGYEFSYKHSVMLFLCYLHEVLKDMFSEL